MIDIHCHILPGLDDGPKDMGEALEMCRVAQRDGIRTIVATPHCENGVYHNQEKTIWPVLEQVREAIAQAGISIQLLPGADLHIHPEAVSFLRENPRLLIGGRYFLLELPAQSIPPFTGNFIFESLLAGYVPILTHPERNSMLQNHPKQLEEWVEAGVVVQITAMSLTGDFGGKVRESALNLVRSGLVDVVASDAHSPKGRPPVLSKARMVLEEFLSFGMVQVMVEEVPEKLILGLPLEKIGSEVVQVKKKSLIKRFFYKRN
jgi:protein-tyrosine phosphatase